MEGEEILSKHEGESENIVSKDEGDMDVNGKAASMNLEEIIESKVTEAEGNLNEVMKNWIKGQEAIIVAQEKIITELKKTVLELQNRVKKIEDRNEKDDRVSVLLEEIKQIFGNEIKQMVGIFNVQISELLEAIKARNTSTGDGSSSAKEEEKKIRADFRQEKEHLYNDESRLQEKLDKAITLSVSVIACFFAFHGLIFHSTTRTMLDFSMLAGLICLVAIGLGFIFFMIWNTIDKTCKTMSVVEEKRDNLVLRTDKLIEKIKVQRAANMVTETEPLYEITEQAESRLQIGVDAESFEEGDPDSIMKSLLRFPRIPAAVDYSKQDSHKFYVIMMGFFMIVFSIYLIVLLYLRSDGNASTGSSCPAPSPAPMCAPSAMW